LFQAQDGSSVPTEDKRNVATLARNGDLPMIRQEYKKFAHPMTWQAGNGGPEAEKRFLHPIATSWQDHTVQESQEDKRFSHPVALPWQAQATFQDVVSKRFSHPLTAALERHIQRALDKRFSHPMTAAALQQIPSRYLEDKRFLGSLARAGNIGSAGKRSDEDYMTDDEVADALLAELVAEFFQRQQEEERELEEENSLEKRFVASLARTGGLPSGKRNIAAMARDGLLTQFSRTHQDHQEPIATDNNEATAEDAEAVESLLDEVTKRHLGSLARSFNMPAGLTSGGKRNVGALARSGMLTRYTNNQRGEDDKRNIGSFMRGRFTGKRSPIRGKYLPFAYARLSGIRDSFVDPGKRNIQALLKSWRPIDQYNTGHGKRYPSYLRTNEIPSTRRYIAALMNSPARVLGQQQQQNDGQKRHLGSLYSTSGNRPKNIQKKSVNPPITDGIVVGGTASSLSVGGSAVARSKRQAFIDDSILGSIEYPMPVLQGSDFYDYEEDLPAAVEEKRFLGENLYFLILHDLISCFIHNISPVFPSYRCITVYCYLFQAHHLKVR
jgi:hypothetical protein